MSHEMFPRQLYVVQVYSLDEIVHGVVDGLKTYKGVTRIELLHEGHMAGKCPMSRTEIVGVYRYVGYAPTEVSYKTGRIVEEKDGERDPTP